jgi:hypothetical protein
MARSSGPDKANVKESDNSSNSSSDSGSDSNDSSNHPKVATQRVVSTWWIITGFPQFVWIINNALLIRQ